VAAIERFPYTVYDAAGDVVDRGKKEVDQFMRIQKVNGQIGESEKKIAERRTQIQQFKVDIGEHAVQMLRAGTLTSPELQALVDQITGTEQQITAEEAVIAEKKAEIEKIKAEDEAAKAQAAAAAAVPTPAASPTVGEPAAVQRPLPAAAAPEAPACAARFCPQCRAAATGSGAFCMQCGAKLMPAVSCRPSPLHAVKAEGAPRGKGRKGGSLRTPAPYIRPISPAFTMSHCMSIILPARSM
jgi:hypothetical protein